MKFNFAVSLVILFVLIKSPCASPMGYGKKLVGGRSHRITTDASEEQHPGTPEPDKTQASTFSIKFIPLFTLITELLKTILSKFGEFNGVNKQPTRKNMTKEREPEKVTEKHEMFDDVDHEKEVLAECNAAHLGLWPDKTNSQRYYKCELDPRTPALANCVKDYFSDRTENKADFLSEQGLVIPVVKPCFLLSLMKCANGFKYSHRARICIPDVVFTSL